ncbi:MAG: lytic transglycosylase domain-containing protein [Rhizobiales bacterium]|nr:lytic transglycosylase domain-containing protein [Hyphomicrobiales bacterium]NRB14819.1 lytic transglycosylase domain-containing protein [Hyphomicrobiales bacterium]
MINKFLKIICLTILLSQNQIAVANISQKDLALSQAAASDIVNKRYEQAKNSIAQMQNDAAKQVALHALYRSSGYVTHYNEIENFIANYPNWKGLTSIKSIMENRIFFGKYDSNFGSDWLNKYPAKTGSGKLFLANQLFLNGNSKQGLKMLRSVWRGYALNKKTEQAVLAKMGSYFDVWDHKVRADFLMNSGMTSAALRNASYAGDAYVRFYQARVALEGFKKNALALVKLVPVSLSDDMGLKYSLLKYYRRDRDEISGLKLLESIDDRDQKIASSYLFWTEKFFIIHMLLDKKHNKNITMRAYKILANHKQSPKSDRYVNAEFKAGWIAYTKFADYKTAKYHFDRAQKRAFSQKHISRIYYWQAQTARKLNDMNKYKSQLEKSAKYPYSFYGQLAGERLGRNLLQIPANPVANPNYQASINQNIHADFIKIYNNLGQVRSLGYHYAKLRSPIKNAGDMASLVSFALAQNNIHFAMDTARKGMTKGWNMQRYAYPLVDFPAYTVHTGKVDKALSFGLIRQESLFNQFAVSSSGARGYMQIMPNTGKYLAQKYKIDYKLSWLVSKPSLNLGLGNSYLYDLIGDFEGSYVLAVAAYNAGGTWVKRWIAANGDPRIGQSSFVNWIESIPKAETRNYVKKVIKNMQVFKSRFNNNSARTNIIGAMITGEK